VRAAVAALVSTTCLTAVACGGSDGASPGAGGGQPAPGTLEAHWRAPGADVALVPGTSDYGPGRVRFSFLVVDEDGRPHEAERARVWVARGLDRRPFAEVEARLEPIVVPGGYEPDAPRLFVATLPLHAPGTYWVVAEPTAGEPIQGLAQLDVRSDPQAPAVGERAPPSETPTLRSTGGDLEALTTRTPPDRSLLRWSVAESLRDGVPFVVAFATPDLCEDRTCGPVVDVVLAVQRRLRGTPARFLHAEVFEGNDRANGTNRWVKEWRLPTEPWTFVVDRDGRVAARFEGALSVRELEQAVRATLR
jgi:hypothetical protein